MSPTAEQVFVIDGLHADTAGISTATAGNKGANLARLATLGLRVPPAIVLGTAFCARYFAGPADFRRDVEEQLAGYLRRLEDATGRQLGGRRPLLVSVRSSPAVSMPGMLDTILNVGLTEPAVQAFIRSTGNPALAWDTWRRFIRSFATVVARTPAEPFDRLTDCRLKDAGVDRVDQLDALTIRSLSRETAELSDAMGGSPPADPIAQVASAVEAVCRSWLSPRAIEYRALHGIADSAAPAVVIQAMVFGNGGGTSGSGVGFTRDPSTGADRLYVDFLFDAQGEDVVSGRQAGSDAARLSKLLPPIAAELEDARHRLESEFGDMQDFEFTVEDGQLFFLQTRTGKRTAWAALQIAVDLVESGIVDPRTAAARLSTIDLRRVERRRLAAPSGVTPIAHGVSAGLGVASGAIAFDVDRARALAAARPVILARTEIATDDIAGLALADGAVTALGGPTSHAAVVARQMNKVCVVGCEGLDVRAAERRCSCNGQALLEGDLVTVDGDSGDIYAGRVPAVVERPDELIATIASWNS